MSQRNYPIPGRNTPPPARPSNHSQQMASDYLRQQIAQIYDGSNGTHDTHVTLEQPSANASTSAPESYDHTYNSQQPPQQQQYDWQTYHSAWQDYYQQYYQRYYLGQANTQAQTPQVQAEPTGSKTENDPYKTLSHTMAGDTREEKRFQNPQLQKVNELKSQLLKKVEQRAKKASASPHFKPILTAVIVGVLFLFLQFNRTIIAQAKYYISPGTLTNEGSSIIINPETLANVGSDSRVVIPKINVDVPVVYDETSYNEDKIQKALERGVVHYGSTAMPGQIGNNVIVGHSSNDLFDGGGYKFAFVLIDRLNNGDIFMLNHEGKRYVYKVYNKAVISPNDFSLININPEKPVVTLITCTPPGTALKRLLVQAEQISPEPNQDQVAAKPAESSLPSNIPGNSPTFFDRVKGIFN